MQNLTPLKATTRWAFSRNPTGGNNAGKLGQETSAETTRDSDYKEEESGDRHLRVTRSGMEVTYWFINILPFIYQ